MDLGIKPSQGKPGGPTMTEAAKKTQYPEFDVRDEHADEIREERECEVGVEGEAKIKFRLSGNVQDKYSNRLSFEITDMDITSYGDGESKKEDEEDEEDKDEEKALGYKRSKPEPKETPDTSAQSLY